MTSTKICCDHCGVDLAPDKFMPKFRIAVQCVRVAPSGPVQAMVFLSPPFSRSLDFCGLECLAGYLNTAPDDRK